MKKQTTPPIPVIITGNTLLSASGPEEEVRLLAYQLWEAAGRPEGCDFDFWIDAEARLRVEITVKNQPVPVETRTRAAAAQPEAGPNRKATPKSKPPLPKGGVRKT